MAAPNSMAVSAATPSGAPSPSDVTGGGIPPELGALIDQLMTGTGVGAPPPQTTAPPAPPAGNAPPTVPQVDPTMVLQALMEEFAATQQMQEQALAPDPTMPDQVGAPSLPVPSQPAMQPPSTGLRTGFAPDFREQFYRRNGRFPLPADLADDAFSRDFAVRTGRPPTKAEMLARMTPSRPPEGISEFQ